ncbi:MAG: formylglycine-generating enzyme family protein [Planctomycetaceae bacterium]|nr:formylglycine-generating enzyme family protein [Planctomycetaceae bacterium]
MKYLPALALGFAMTLACPLQADDEEEMEPRIVEALKNPIFQSALLFIAEPAPLPDSVAKTEAEMKPYTEKIFGSDQTFNMVPIKGGKFKMGSPESEEGRNEDEGPQIEVEVQPFWMEEHETTWREYEQFAMKYVRQGRKTADALSARDRIADAHAAPTSVWGTSTAHANRGKDGYPVAGITMYAAQAYCKWLTALTGRYYRLPTEAEWEYACRAGTTTPYSFGKDAENLDDYACWFENCMGEVEKIKTKKPNPWGLYDMYGNVAEWVLEEYAKDTYAQRKPGTFAAPVKPPVSKVGSKDGINIVRGGNVDCEEPADLRSACRVQYSEEWRKDDPQYPKSIWWLTSQGSVGFRVVRPLNPPKTEEEAKQYEPDPKVWIEYFKRNTRDS